jgi:Ca-activated chloride channel family protein
MKKANGTYTHILARTLWLIGFTLLFGKGYAQTAVPASLPVKTRILFMLDASGSMTNNWGNTNRFRVSKNILSGLVDSLQKVPNVEIGLRVFGSMSPLNMNDCKDTRLEAPIRPNNANAIKNRLNTLQCKGITPIAYSIEQAANDFLYSNERTRNIIILITDGIESCNGDACEVSKRLQKKGIILQPFIIGLGLTKEAAATFDCIGRYDDAQDEIGFRRSLKSVMNTILNNTTTQINLLDENGKATESNVPVTFYDHNSGSLRYQFMHTLNARGLPDTLQIDPVSFYDLTVHTVPPIEKKDIIIEPNQHNVIALRAGQGDLLIQVDGLSTYKELSSLVKQEGKAETIDVIGLNTKRKYLCGTYDLEILTLPRLTVSNIRIRQSETTTIKIPAPGIVTILNTNSVPVQGAIYVERGMELEWVCDINGNTSTETLTLQPGSYRVIYKTRGSKKAMSTREEKFKISSGSSVNIRF